MYIYMIQIWLQLRKYMHECSTTSSDRSFDISSRLTSNACNLTQNVIMEVMYLRTYRSSYIRFKNVFRQ